MGTQLFKQMFHESSLIKKYCSFGEKFYQLLSHFSKQFSTQFGVPDIDTCTATPVRQACAK